MKTSASVGLLPLRILALALLGALGGCASHYGARTFLSDRAEFRRPVALVHPADNPFSEAKVELGARLFADPHLSRDGSMSCATCHDPRRDFQDDRPVPIRSNAPVAGTPAFRTPTLWNVGAQRRFFWDGRARSLEEQALAPIANPLEMNHSAPEAVARLAADPGYAAQFAAAFPEDHEKRVVTPRNLGRALAAYQRTLVSPEAPFDRWVSGDPAAISPSARRGFDLFTGKASCIACHTGWNFSDGRRHDIGLPATAGTKGGTRFKTPTLRELTGRAPYFHDGSKPTLEAVIDHYAGGASLRRGTPAPVALTSAEKADLLAFLRSLDSRTVEG